MSDDARWTRVGGSILREGKWTEFTIVARGVLGNRVSQTIYVETERLKVPGVYKRTLDLIVRDISVRLGE